MQQTLEAVKTQATQATARFKELGLSVSKSQVLEGFAAAAGYRTWHAYKAFLETEPAKPDGVVIPSDLANAIRDVVSSASNDGCSDDLIVTSQDAVTDLENLFDKYASKVKSVPSADSWSHIAGTPMSDVEYVQDCGNHCPNCGKSEYISAHPKMHTDADYAWRDVECGHCGASWEDSYQLVGYSDLKLPELNLAAIEASLAKVSVSDEDMDELVHEIVQTEKLPDLNGQGSKSQQKTHIEQFESLASNINNEGLAGQLAYLHRVFGSELDTELWVRFKVPTSADVAVNAFSDVEAVVADVRARSVKHEFGISGMNVWSLVADSADTLNLVLTREQAHQACSLLVD